MSRYRGSNHHGHYGYRGGNGGCFGAICALFFMMIYSLITLIKTCFEMGTPKFKKIGVGIIFTVIILIALAQADVSSTVIGVVGLVAVIVFIVLICIADEERLRGNQIHTDERKREEIRNVTSKYKKEEKPVDFNAQLEQMRNQVENIKDK